MNRKLIIPHLALFLANLIYAGNYTIAKEIMPKYIGPFGMIVLRVLAAAIIFTFFHWLFCKEPIRSGKDYGHLLLCSLFGVAINQLMFFKGLSLTNPINPSIIMTVTPVLVLIASYFILKESLGWTRISGILLGITGAVLLILFSFDEQFKIGKSNALGDFFVFINASSYGLYLVLVKPLLKKYKPITVMRWIFTFGIIWVLPVGGPELMSVNWHSISLEIWLCVGYVLLLVTVVAYFLNSWALVKLSPTMVSFYIYLQPILAGAIAISLGKDSLNLLMILCSVLIFAGVYLVSKKEINV